MSLVVFNFVNAAQFLFAEYLLYTGHYVEVGSMQSPVRKLPPSTDKETHMWSKNYKSNPASTPK